jgi:hypothetical protein
MKKWEMWKASPAGRVVEVVIYAVLLVLICLYFTGTGVFVYEGF